MARARVSKQVPSKCEVRGNSFVMIQETRGERRFGGRNQGSKGMQEAKESPTGFDKKKRIFSVVRGRRGGRVPPLIALTLCLLTKCGLRLCQLKKLSLNFPGGLWERGGNSQILKHIWRGSGAKQWDHL